MVLGISGVFAILSGVASGTKMEHLELSEFPNMPFLYWLAVAGALVKPKWTENKKWPAIKVSMTTPTAIDAKRLKTFKALAAWPDPSSSDVPMMFLMAESFRLVMQVLTLPAFPVSVLGTVVNKRARYSYLRKVDASESLTYSCTLNPAVRETFSGHAEFDLLLEATSQGQGDVVWQAVLSLVLMNPKKSKGGKKDGGAAAPKPQEDAATGETFDTWVLPENTGRAYAALDGDISPMHLYKATAMLMGFPSPVANVHLLAARTEASIASKKASVAEPAAPFSLELDFKKPTLLPNRLGVTGGADYSKAAAADGYELQVADKKGKPIAAGTVSTKAVQTRF